MKTSPLALTVSLLLAFGLHSLEAQTWTWTYAPNAPRAQPWYAMSCSADGKFVIGTGDDGYIYLSTNYGVDWAQTTGTPDGQWDAAWMSPDGKTMLVVGNEPYVSTNSGATWAKTGPSILGGYTGVCASSNATIQILGEVANPYYSLNAGGNWTLSIIHSGNYQYNEVACSADGSRVVDCGYNQGLFLSTNSGVKWTNVFPTNAEWQCVSCTPDGSKWVAGIFLGSLYYSTNYGLTWTTTSNQPTGGWSHIAMSADGTKLLAADGFAGPVWQSFDGGASWQQSKAGGDVDWYGCTMSADGTRAYICAPYVGIYVGQITIPQPTLNVTNAGTNVILSWDATASSFHLQQNPNLATTNWTGVTNTPVNNSGTNQVSLPASAAAEFYRLKFP